MTKDITVRFDTKRCIHSRHCVLEAPKVFRANTPGAWIHPEATSVEHVVRTAHNCPSGAITYERRDGGPPETPPAINVVRVRENGPYAGAAAIALKGTTQTRATLCRCGQSKNKPYCDNSHIAAKLQPLVNRQRSKATRSNSAPAPSRSTRSPTARCSSWATSKSAPAPAAQSRAPKTPASAAAADQARNRSATARTRGSGLGVKVGYIANCLTRCSRKLYNNA